MRKKRRLGTLCEFQGPVRDENSRGQSQQSVNLISPAFPSPGQSYDLKWMIYKNFPLLINFVHFSVSNMIMLCVHRVLFKSETQMACSHVTFQSWQGIDNSYFPPPTGVSIDENINIELFKFQMSTISRQKKSWLGWMNTEQVEQFRCSLFRCLLSFVCFSLRYVFPQDIPIWFQCTFG